MNSQPFHRLNLEIPSMYLKASLQAFEVAGIPLVFQRNGKLVRLGPGRNITLPWQDSDPLAEFSAVQVWTYVLPEYSRPLLESIAPAIGLDNPGKAAAYISQVELLGQPHALAVFKSAKPLSETRLPLITLNQLMGISCILNRGEGLHLVRAALELGTCVPSVCFAHGMGLRDKLGLLRIAMPAAKELVHLAVPDHDAPGVLEHLIEEAKINQPGKGFLSLYPIEEGIVNSRITEGKQRHAASMEQVVSALDSLQGSTLWRRRFEGGSTWKFKYLRDMTGLTLLSAEGIGLQAAAKAMDVGASGATGSLVKGICNEDLRNEGFQVAREECTIVVNRARSEAVCEALYQEGQHYDPFAFVEIQSRPLAYVYTR